MLSFIDMRATRRALGCALALVCCVALAAAQQGVPQVTAQLDTGLARLGAAVRCRVSVEKSSGDRFREAKIVELPRVDGLELEGSTPPAVGEQMTFRDGRRSVLHTIEWVLTFRPRRVGEYTIPPLELRVDGQTMHTRELTLSVVEDLQGKELGYIDFVQKPTDVYEGEPFTIDLLAGWDAALGQDVNYLNLILPWWGELPGTLEIDTGEGRRSADRLAVPLNTRQQVLVEDAGLRQVRGKDFRVFRLRRSFVATRPGPLTFPESNVEFGQVVNNLIERRKQTYYVGYPSFSIEVKPLPEEGRPFEFSGAVGSLGANAQADRRDVDAGDSIKLTVEWRGSGNLEFFQAPDLTRLDAFKSFRVYGTTDRFYGDRRVVIYDLAPVSPTVSEIPGVPLVIFDPELAAYRTISTPPLSIRVRALEGASALDVEGAASGPVLDIRDIQLAPAGGVAREPRGPGALAVGGSMALVPLAWLALRTAVRRRGDPDSAEARRKREATRHLRRELARAKSAKDEAHAFHRFLAARTGETEEAWEGRDPLEPQGALEGRIARDEARALAETLRELEARRWAGGDQPLGSERLLAAADRLVKAGL